MKKYILIISMLFLFQEQSYAVCKKCIRYAKSDAAGAWSGFELGSLTGNPMGQALGIVLGGIISSGYDYWDDHTPQSVGPGHCCGGTAGTNKNIKELSEYELSGYKHNEGLMYVINDLKNLSIPKTEIYPLLYEKSLKYISIEHNIAIGELRLMFPEEVVKNKIINLEIENNLFNNFLTDIDKASSNDDFFNIVDKHTKIVLLSNDLSEVDKKKLLHSYSVASFSFSYWSKNTN